MLALPEHPLIEGEAVSILIPQKTPVVMVDKLWYNDEIKTITGFFIIQENIFCAEGLFREPGIVENIAQSAALRAGYMFSLMINKERRATPPTGYIGAIKKLTIYQLPKSGTELITEIIMGQAIFDVTLITGKTTQNGEIIAECEMKIFLKID